MILDADTLLAEVVRGAGVYQLSPIARRALRTQIRTSLGQFGGEGASVDDPLGERLRSAFYTLGLRLADDAVGRRGVRPDTFIIQDAEVAGLLGRLCPGFWPIC